MVTLEYTVTQSVSRRIDGTAIDWRRVAIATADDVKQQTAVIGACVGRVLADQSIDSLNYNSAGHTQCAFQVTQASSAPRSNDTQPTTVLHKKESEPNST